MMKKFLPFLALFLGLLSLPGISHAQSGLTIQQSSTSRNLLFLLVSSTDHITAVTGITPTVTISKNGATFASPAGTVSEVGNGWYKLAPTSADTGTGGLLIVHATGTGADPSESTYNVVAYNPDSATNLGLSNLDTTISSRGTSTYAGGDTTGTTTLLSRLSSTRATALDNLDATVSSRSTYSGADTSGTTTLLSRLTGTRATAFDFLDASISSRLATSGYTAPPAVPTASDNAVAVWASGTRSLTDKAGFSLSQTFPTNFSLMAINGSGAITTSNPATGGSSLSITDVQTALTNQGVTTARAGYLDNIATTPPTGAAITALVKAGTAPSWYTDPPTTSQIAAAVAGIVVDNTGSTPLTMKQAQALMQAALTGKYVVGTFNTVSHTQVTTYYKADGATIICTSTVQYGTNNTTVLGRTTVWANLP